MKSVRDLVTEASNRVESVSPNDAQAELEAGTAVFIDVREPVDWEAISRARTEIRGACSSSSRTPSVDRACRPISSTTWTPLAG